MTREERTLKLREVTRELVGTYRTCEDLDRIGEEHLPSQSAIVSILNELLALVFPGYHGPPVPRDADLDVLVGSRLDVVGRHLSDVITGVLIFCQRVGGQCDRIWELTDVPRGEERFQAAAGQVTIAYLEQLPAIRRLLDRDVQAAFAGDPAATNIEEIILCYPGLQAIAIHRLAHPLYGMGVPLLPRIMNEWAHHLTGVDIHPGAEIGRDFFIDHGTGVVIGETTRIGEGVKIYQGVTLGALSFPRHEDGTLVKGGKRHPTIGDEVTIYANATILGGETVIGDGAVIGGGTWLTRSVPPGAKVGTNRTGPLPEADF
jgi:serine O-acetyltransferase